MNKVAVVTGGAKGIGAEIVKVLINNGFKVGFIYNKSEEQAGQLIKDINDGGNLKVIGVKADLRDYDNAKKAIAYILSVFGRIDVLVNNAGISNYKLLMDTTVNEWKDVMSSNIDSAFYCTKTVIPHMLGSGGGSIINISSVWGIYGGSMEVAYSASKSALIGFTKALSRELGSADIRVNCIAPGIIATDMNNAHSEETLKELENITPLGRIGKPSEVAELVGFLASDKSRFITGDVIEIGGGFIG